MTVPITGSVRDVTGVEDNDTPWSFASVIRFADDGSVITEKPREVRAVSGNLKVNLVPGYAIVTYGKQVWQVTVPETATTLKALIEAGVAFPPDTAQDLLNAAVAEIAPALIADELEAQTADAVDADLAARPISWADAGGGTTQLLLGGAPAGSPLDHLPGNVWSGIAGSDAEQAPGFRPSVNLINSKVNLEREAVGVNWSNGAEVRTHIHNVWNTYAGQRDIVMPAREYLIGVSGVTGANRLIVPSGLHVEGRPGALLVANQVDNQSSPTLLLAAGSDGTKTSLGADIGAGAQTVTLPSGEGATFVQGDLIGFESTGAVTISNGVNVGYAREIRRITHKVGDTVALDIPLEYTYLTSDSAQFWKITPAKDIILEGLEFVTGPGVTAGSDGSYALRLNKTSNVRVPGLRITDMIGGVMLEDAYDTVIDDPQIHGLPYFSTAYAYGICARASTTRLTINNYRASRMRHTFTTLADERTGSPNTFWGGPMFVQINNPICSAGSDSTFAVFDTHEFGRHIYFNNPIATGGQLNQANGYQMRAQHVQFTNPRAIRCGKYGLLLFSSARDCKVLGGEFAFNGADGILAFGDNHQLSNVRSHHNGGPGISLIGTNDMVIINPDLYENTLRGISDSTTTPSVRTRVLGGRVPKSTAQTQSIANAPSTMLIKDMSCLGYGAGATGLNNTHASALYDIQTDTTRVSNITPSWTNPAAVKAGLALAPADVGALSLPGGFVTGNWYQCGLHGGLTTGVPTLNRIVYQPWNALAAVTVSELQIEFTAAGSADSLIRLGFYLDNGSGKPGALIAEAGTISTGTGNAGAVATGGTPGVYSITGISIAIPAGVVWYAAKSEGTTSATFRVPNTSATPMQNMTFGTVTPVSTQQTGVWIQAAGAAGALPSTAGATATSVPQGPRALFKAA